MISYPIFSRTFTISDFHFRKWSNKESKKISKLRECLIKNVNQAELPCAAVHVIDGDAPLSVVQWLSNTTYSGVIKQHRKYLLAAFGRCTVIFDDYNSGPSTKDIKYQVREAKLPQIVRVDLNKEKNISQEKFLKNGKNKTILISFLRDNLRKYGFSKFEVTANTDTLNAKAAVQKARNGSDALIHAHHVNVFCLLMYQCKDVSDEVLV